MSPSSSSDRPNDGVTLWRDGRPVYDRGDTVCVIGAGASGLAAIKNLREHGFGVDCYERETGVGGAWNWRHDRSPVYASTHLISSKPFTQFPDFPMPDDWPDYPHHASCCPTSSATPTTSACATHIWFGTEVVRVEPADGDQLGRHHAQHRRVRRRRGADRTATPPWSSPTGTTGRRSCPAYEGLEEFRGQVMHASAYKDAGPAARASGCWSSAPATPAATSPSRPPSRRRACWHSTRRGYWYAPKYVFGRPADQVNDSVLALRLPLRAAAVALPPHAAADRRRPDPLRPAEAGPQGVRDAPDRQQPARLLRGPRRDHPGAGRRAVPRSTPSS